MSSQQPQHGWSEVVAWLRAEADPCVSEHVPRFYELAVRDGRAALHKYRGALGEARVEDLIHDLLAAHLGDVVRADNPRAFLATALVRRAISWLRRKDARVLEARDDDGAFDGDSRSDAIDFVLDARSAIAQLGEREQEIVFAVACGNDREQIAKELGTSRANVDQIVSRARRKLRELEP